MLESFLISLREGVEISLIVAILLAYLNRVERRGSFRAVWAGVGASALVCVALAIAFLELVGGFEGRAEVATEAIVSGAAAAMLTFMIFWMRSHARELKGKLQDGLGRAIEHSAVAVAAFAGIAVLREGIETALLLIGAERGAGVSVGAFVGGGLAGLAAAVAIGVLVYRGSTRVDLRRFFSITAFLLILFAAGMVGKAAHEFAELFAVSGLMQEPFWTIETPLLSTSWVARLMAGMFGWSAHPVVARAIGYVAYVVPVLALYFGDRVAAAATRVTSRRDRTVAA
jgi:high-affinity iron transporter